MNKPETSSVTSNKLHKRPWFVLLLAIGVAVTGLCIYFSSVSLSRPYIGADLKLENQQWVVLSVEHPGLAHAKGIEQGDIVISVNGQEPLDFPQEYVGMKIISSHLVNQLSVNSNEETIELSVYNSSIPLANIQETVILSIISFFFLLIGFFVYIKKGMNRASILFYLVSIVAGLEFVTVLAYDRNLFLLFELQAIILIVLPWLVAHLFWIFPSKKKWFTRHPYAEYLLYVPCVIMLVLFFAGGHSAGQDSPWFRVAIAMNLAAGLLFGLSLLFHSYATATSIRTRQQSKMIFVGMLLAILPMLLLVVLPDVIISRKIVPVHIAGLFLLFSPLSISYTIVKYQLMDINVVLKKGTSYLLMSTIVAIPYVLLIYLATTHLRPDLLAPVLIPLLVLLALGMNPIWSRVQNKVDKWFYRQRYDFLKNLERFNQEAHSINDIGKFGFSIVHLLNQSIEDTYISLLLLTESKNYTTIATTEDNSVHVSLKSNNPVSKWLKLNMKILHHWEIELTEQLQALTDKQQQEIKNIELFAPLITPNSEMVGILLLGPRKQGRKYSQADELLIMTIAKRVSIELENARLYNLEKGMRKELESQDEQKTELLFSIAHELKTPLSAIVSSSELLSSEIAARSNHREANLIRNVSRSAWWMSKRVTELLDIARLEISAIELNLAPVNVGSVIKDIASRLFYVFKNKGQTLKTQIPRGLPKVNGDLERLEQIMFNLLSNANKYSPTDSVIMLHAAQNNSKVVVEVEDAGPSVSEQDKKRIFEPYNRGSDYDMIKRLPGLGLGLAICKKLVMQHQGEIWVTPKHQRGNIFSFSIPIHKPEIPANKKK